MMTKELPQGVSNSDINKVRSFNDRLRDLFVPKIKLSPEEEVLMNIIYKILEAPGTIKMTPVNGTYYLINSNLHYFVKANEMEVTIVNTVDSISRNLSYQVGEFLKKAIDRSVARDVELLEKTMFNNGLAILDKIEAKLVSNAENTSST